MILLKNFTENDVVLTLSEAVSYTDPIFVFEVTNDTTQEITIFTAEDISPAIGRYNEFMITNVEFAEEIDLMDGKILLIPGFHTYNVYEAPNDVEDPLEINSEIYNLLETGKLLVQIDTERLPSYSSEQEFPVYDPDN